MKSVSEAFHERARRVLSGSPVNFFALAEYPPKVVAFFLRASGLEDDLSNKDIVEMNNESPSKPTTAKIGENHTLNNQADAGPSGRFKPSVLHTQEKIDPRLQQKFHENSDPAISEPRLSSTSTGHVAFTALFESVVDPALKKSKKRHKDSLSWEKLDAIGKIVSLTSVSKKEETSLSEDSLTT